ncbi:hypothetical protein Ptr902_13425 [Pyrenophora tritici-repentis]|uniref:Uncharacterized protein n=1 Tax=Pyrenophora tritici-repentis TaxID=45151 RepID=A0A2W1HIS6_9PLEO|nr:hypothetical protein PtrV1_06558 [Pyrenophora tritici-repentis]KAF7447609.1 hypothetical protein A1F99_069730 [Pyrenophora tritici-repentis]KAF7571302.1 hypothetical protein PtrM4_088020 [Pyrenophora tritici-repentis]KAI0574072.1 hypothetical protein Alg215_08815 [Pyrenophora tritici-repentis]KAI0574440.1 hypothetical protein Alg130_09692 [Pyrenophora tritici-repentis]
MKYFAALSVAAATVVSATEMQVMPLAPAPAAGPATHTVVVGGLKAVETGMAAILGYNPESITANVGDMVQFVFMQKNHTATQSTFANPCKKMDGGMDSGFMPNPEGKDGVTWNMTVETQEPLWFYCKQQNGIHCGKGMVFSINAATTGNKTMADFKQLAIKTNGTSLVAGDILSADPAAAAAPTTVTISAGGGGGGAAATGTNTGSAAAEATPPPPPATVVAGTGVDGQGAACSCSCLCGIAAFPQNAAINNFGGFAGMIA